MKRDRDQKITNAADDDSQDEQYNEAEDEDYNPQQQAVDEDVSSSEDEAADTTIKPGKRKANIIDDALDSGDEATIKARVTKKRRKHDEEDEEQGSEPEGGLIKTRSQRLAEKSERRQQKKKIGGQVTVNVDELWSELTSLPVGAPATVKPLYSNEGSADPNDTSIAGSDTYIKIKRQIKFAGQITEVEDEVPRTSDEAQRYLAEQEQAATEEKSSARDGLQKPLRRMSLFEPNPLGIVKGIPPEKLRRRAPSRMDLAMAEKRAEEERRKKAEKLSTMQKTALDWKGFVIEQGLGEELNDYGKSKKGFLAREQFLDKVHGANEVARRTARLKA